MQLTFWEAVHLDSRNSSVNDMFPVSWRRFARSSQATRKQNRASTIVVFMTKQDLVYCFKNSQRQRRPEWFLKTKFLASSVIPLRRRLIASVGLAKSQNSLVFLRISLVLRPSSLDQISNCCTFLIVGQYMHYYSSLMDQDIAFFGLLFSLRFQGGLQTPVWSIFQDLFQFFFTPSFVLCIIYIFYVFYYVLCYCITRMTLNKMCIYFDTQNCRAIHLSITE